MDVQVVQVLAISVYKFVSLVTGVLLCYMGFKLFMSGIWGSAGDVSGEFGDNKLVIKKAAPGTFFVLAGVIVIGMTIFKGLSFENAPIQKGQISEKPLLVD